MNDFLKSLFGVNTPKQSFVPTKSTPAQMTVAPKPQTLAPKPQTSAKVTPSSLSAVGPSTYKAPSTKTQAITSPAGQAYVSQLPTFTAPTQNYTYQPLPEQPIQQAQPASQPAQPSARESYIDAYKKYQTAQQQSQQVSEARKAYNNFLAEQAKAVAGREGRGLGIPLQIVRGEQERLLKQTQPEAQRLQGDIEIAQIAQGQEIEAARSGLDLQEKLFGFDLEEQKAQRDAAKPIVVDGIAYAQQADGSLKPLTSREQEAFNLSEGQTRYEYDPTTGGYKAVASKAKTYAPDSYGVDTTGYSSKQLSALTKLNEDIADSDTFKKTTAMRTYANNVLAALAAENGVSDIAAINQFQKVIDEGAVTRDQDVTLIRGAQSLVDRLKTMESGLRAGEKLSKTQRAEMTGLINSIYETQVRALQNDPYIQAKTKEASLYNLKNEDTVLGGLEGFQRGGQTQNQSQNDFSDIMDFITPDPATRVAYIPRSVWSTLGPRMDALLADVASDGYTLKIRD